MYGTIPPISGVSVNGATSLAGFNSSRVSFDADNIYVNWQGLTAVPSQIVSLDVQFTEVPEPATLALVGLSGLELSF